MRRKERNRKAKWSVQLLTCLPALFSLCFHPTTSQYQPRYGYSSIATPLPGQNRSVLFPTKRTRLTGHGTGSTLSSIARTVNLAFSPDPLIQWLRPNAIPWAQETPATCRWQYRRIQRVLLEGLVFQSLPVKEMAEYFPSKSALANDRPTPSEWVASDSGSDSGAVLFLFPPREQWKWTVKKLFMALQLWILDKLNPVLDVDSPVTVGHDPAQ